MLNQQSKKPLFGFRKITIIEMPDKRQGQIRIFTPAKITPRLHVMKKRADGYHEVCILLVPVSLYDCIDLSLSDQEGTTLEVLGADLGPTESNLVSRAVEAFRERAGLAGGVRIRLEKIIPHGAGLGGGSGNAAGTLVAINHLHGNPLDVNQLREMAAGFGSDIPFFITPSPTIATGRGERLEPVSEFPALQILILAPPFSISTGEAYGAVTPGPPVTRLPVMNTLDAVRTHLANDFEAPVFQKFPELLQLRQTLLKHGATGALLSGSGTALFGVFADRAALTHAVETLNLPPGWRLFPCQSLETHDYFRVPDPAHPSV